MSNPMHILGNGGKNNNFFCYNIFQVTIFLKDSNSIIFEESTNEKYVTLFNYKNNINFNDIRFYEVNVTLVSFIPEKFNVKNKFIIQDDHHIFKNDSIYIEFNKNDDDNTNCFVSLIHDKSRMFFTPPNY
jgi:hypothetical protein